MCAVGGLRVCAVGGLRVCAVELSLFGKQYNDNIKYCQLGSTGTSRIEKAKYNTHDKRNIIMTDDLHVPVTSAEFSI